MHSIAGIDIAKDHLDVCVAEGQIQRFDSDAAGRRKLLEHFSASGITIAVFEATGGLERSLKLDLQRAGFEHRCINPRQIRQFARSSGQLAKTDNLDASMIRTFGVVMRPPARGETSERMIELEELLSRRDQLMQMKTAERNRLKQVMSASIRASIEQCLVLFTAEVKQIEASLKSMIAEDSVQAGLGLVLIDVEGVGEQTTNAMLIRVPELGRVPRTRISALVGIAPMNNDSGKFRGQRRIMGGRSNVRSVLYMAALTGIKHNQTLRTYYEGLRARGKPFKVAIVACMRKLLIHLNAIAREYYESLGHC